jgi:hypothetical protein
VGERTGGLHAARGEAMKSYWLNWSLYLRGFRWLWSRNLTGRGDWVDYFGIHYKPGWTPTRFLLPYCTTILLSVVLGFGVVPFSTVVWWRCNDFRNPCDWCADRWCNLRTLIDRVLGEDHCRDAGPWLWGSTDCWK